jgi:(2Fe-2S) ferredoxin
MPSDPPESRRFQIRVCDGPSCGVTHESELLVELLAKRIDGDDELKARVGVCNYTCFGRCDDGPNMFVHELGPDDDPDEDPEDDVLEEQRGFYPGMNEEKVVRVLEEHCRKGEIVADLIDDY